MYKKRILFWVKNKKPYVMLCFVYLTIHPYANFSGAVTGNVEVAAVNKMAVLPELTKTW